jgi:hypothetical protein
MRVRGALHVHSTLSRDGTMSIGELARWYKQRAYQFLAMGEHAEDLDEAKVQQLREQSAENSHREFLIIPGIEFAVTSTIHIVGIRAVSLINDKTPVDVAQKIHEQGGFTILAHPKRMRWECPAEVCQAVNAAEIWNVGYDGKYLPSPKALSAFRRMRDSNPRLLAVASHDFHRTESFYDVAIEMDVASLSDEAILQNLREGAYSIRSRFFRSDSAAGVSWIDSFSLALVSPQLDKMRKARSLFLRWSA